MAEFNNERQVTKDTQAIKEMLRKFGKHSIMDLTTSEINSLPRDMQNLIMSRKEIRETVPRYAGTQHFKNGRMKALNALQEKAGNVGLRFENETAAFIAGGKAWNHNQGEKENPYSEGTFNFTEWKKGFKNAERNEKRPAEGKTYSKEW